tara:strand:+ start:963 stop:1184 length:222 start_codon:yes stop_codon:yes gene_type:complete
MFIVMCRVEGGVTGFREAPLTRSQEVVNFETREAAQAEAITHTNANRSSHARFSYWAEEVADKKAAEARRVRF